MIAKSKLAVTLYFMKMSDHTNHGFRTTFLMASRPQNDGTPNPSEKIVTIHEDMNALRQWANFHGFVFGTPQVYTPFFSAERSDGTSLSAEESALIRKFASEEKYIIENGHSPYAGAANVAMCNFLSHTIK